MKRKDFIRAATGIMAGVSGLGLSSFSELKESNPLKLAHNLKPGSTIALTAPAGAIWNAKQIDKIRTILNDEGFNIVIGETNYQQEGYLAGSDKERAHELMSFFENDKIDAILTMRGGWGCARILDLLDYDIIAKHPKIIMGFSDITSLINAIYLKTNLVTFHGPSGYSSWGKFTLNHVKKALVSTLPFQLKNPPENKKELKTWSTGKAKGRLIGGNLTVIVSMIGTGYEPNWKGKLLFLEEIGEEPYRIDRMLWQLKQAGVFKKINGLILGSFKNCTPEEPAKSYELAEVFEQHFRSSPTPVYQGASFGHIAPKFTIPIGVLAEMDADKKIINTLEKAVKI
ncbi:S66 peptidase family protein [Crocinitomix algicola]|uniref:S66 peptidase family protein n=1 Tax=Crocinitomix algicola TaxID=1740263 RepID=UPI0009F6908E|nr:LD-carboxypeptidase [Crocinitomix algicola]